METVKRAIIIAAGQGNRLRPVTESMPKPLVPVNGVRIIDTILQALRKNGVKDIYVVVGYKKEQFYELYGGIPDIHILENPQYLDGNNILSVYMAREYLPDSFVIEGDVLIRNPDVFLPEIERSQYCVQWMPSVPEWAVKMVGGRMVLCDINGNVNDAYRMWGISMWNRKDGEVLSELIRRQIEEKKDASIYWDEVALSMEPQSFDLGIREIKEGDLAEIDTIRELAEMDPSYAVYC